MWAHLTQEKRTIHHRRERNKRSTNLWSTLFLLLARINLPISSQFRKSLQVEYNFLINLLYKEECMNRMRIDRLVGLI